MLLDNDIYNIFFCIFSIMENLSVKKYEIIDRLSRDVSRYSFIEWCQSIKK